MQEFLCYWNGNLTLSLEISNTFYMQVTVNPSSWRFRKPFLMDSFFLTFDKAMAYQRNKLQSTRPKLVNSIVTNFSAILVWIWACQVTYLEYQLIKCENLASFQIAIQLISGWIYSQMRHMVGKETFLQRTDESNDLW